MRHREGYRTHPVKPGALITTLNPGRMDEIRRDLVFALDMREGPPSGS